MNVTTRGIRALMFCCVLTTLAVSSGVSVAQPARERQWLDFDGNALPFENDEDVLEFSGALSDPTSGSFSMDLDLSSLGIASGEDIGSLEIFE